MLDRPSFEARDAEDPLAGLVARFHLPEGLIYLDGNSLGPLPAHVPEVVRRVVEDEWGQDLILSWNHRGWWEMAREVGERLAPLLGVAPGTVVAGDTTTVALFKAGLAGRMLRPGRSTILTDGGNFPTDLYALQSVARLGGSRLLVAESPQVIERIDDEVALVALTHVDFRTGERHDMRQVTDTALRRGAVVLWDLSHSAGAMDIDLGDAHLAVGCGYKYLNGGPGAPAYTYVHPEVVDEIRNPISGWWGHSDPFAMSTSFQPASGIGRMQVGTQPIISLASLHAALEVFEGVDPAALRVRSEQLTEGFLRLVEERLPEFGVVTPMDAKRRGSHVALSHPRAAAIMAALRDQGVIGDVRPPDLLRFGLAPAFQRHLEVWDAVETLRRVMDEQSWRRATVPAGPVT